MMQWIEEVSLVIVSFAALGRCMGIFTAKFRQFGYRKRAAVYPSTWRDRCAGPEPFLLFAMTLVLLAGHETPANPAISWDLVSAVGALSGLAGISLMLWAFLSFPAVSTGHYVLPDQQIVTKGPYGRVRHPLYLAALLIWLGLTIRFRSPASLLALVVYVVPAYLIYIRAEERMMTGHFGELYRAYGERVGMLFPRGRRSISESPE